MIMQKKSFTFKISADLLDKVRDKAERYDLNMGQVIRRLLAAWYYDVLPLPILREDGAEESAAIYLPINPHHSKTLTQIAAEQGIQPMTAERWLEMQPAASPWRDDAEFEQFLEFIRADRRSDSEELTLSEEPRQPTPALEFALGASGG